MKVGPVAKAVVAALGSLSTALAPVVADEVFSASETGQVVAALVTAGATVYGVWKTRNKPAAKPAEEPATDAEGYAL